ncbi:MAG: acetyl-CoA carboxylase biotin carboxyl carrier protein [Rhizobiaceae bacterium]
MSSKKSAIDTKLIRELADLLNETELTEIEVDEGDLHIRLSRGGPVMQQAPMMAPAPMQAPVGGPMATATETPAPVSGTPITSPMVGTAYLAPAPGADVFISVGDKVKKGQTILIVEAMKTMNQIPCDQDGIVASIDVTDGQPIEFGETLITLK